MDNKPKIILVHESVADSWKKDILTFITMMLPLVVNHLFLGGSVVLDVIFLVLVLAWWLSQNSPAVHKFYSLEDARDFVNSEEVDADEYDR